MLRASYRSEGVFFIVFFYDHNLGVCFGEHVATESLSGECVNVCTLCLFVTTTL